MQQQDTFEGKTLAQWFDILGASGQHKFLDARKHLMEHHQLDTSPATDIARSYVEYLEQHAPSVWFQDKGRSGTVGYKGPEGSFSVEYEFGGGNTLAILFIPSPAHWEASTGIAASKREAVLHTLGRLVVERQTSGRGAYEIQDSFLLITH